jgi:hypothetical protein
MPREAWPLPSNPALAHGYLVPPTIFRDVDHGSPLAREEIFGPVMAVFPFEDVDEVVALANDTDYGVGRRGLDPRRQEGAPDREGAPGRDGVGERLAAGADGGAVGRLRADGDGEVILSMGAGGLPGDQAHIREPR